MQSNASIEPTTCPIEGGEAPLVTGCGTFHLCWASMLGVPTGGEFIHAPTVAPCAQVWMMKAAKCFASFDGRDEVSCINGDLTMG